jgi:hypothetical protein
MKGRAPEMAKDFEERGAGNNLLSRRLGRLRLRKLLLLLCRKKKITGLLVILVTLKRRLLLMQ